MSAKESVDPRDEEEELVKRCIAQLMEHFECVQIFVSKSDGEGTQGFNYGGGNLYARIGHAEEWVESQKTYVREHAKKVT